MPYSERKFPHFVWKFLLQSVFTNVVVLFFLDSGMKPRQKHFYGKTMHFKSFVDKHLIPNGITTAGFVSASSAFTNYPSFRNMLDELLRRGIPADIAHKVESTSGCTRYGGVWENYNTLKDLNIGRNGIISGKGLSLPWADVDRIIYVGNN